MWTPAILTAALALGQPGVDLPNVVPASAAADASARGGRRLHADESAVGRCRGARSRRPRTKPPPRSTSRPPCCRCPPRRRPAAAPAAAAAAPPPRWFLMKELQGTYLGSELDGNNIAVYGWVEGSGTASTAGISNEPMAWNDRANRVLLQQMFIRVERTVVTTGTTMPTWGFRTDWLVGSDYRFTLPRGILNGQLVNQRTPTQNLYGVDPVEFYGEVYIPNVQQGLDIKVGRFYAPFGEESIEAVSTPLVSRSYTFNSGPEFTNTGVLATLTIDPVWPWPAATPSATTSSSTPATRAASSASSSGRSRRAAATP